MFVLYLPTENGFYYGVIPSTNTLLSSKLDNCMRFNSLFCSDWYEAIFYLCKNDVPFTVLKVEFEKNV